MCHGDGVGAAVTARRIRAPRASRPELGPLPLHPIPGRLVTAEFGRCPVCHHTVTPDCDNHIRRHRDGIGRLCPATGFPYKITNHQEEYA